MERDKNGLITKWGNEVFDDGIFNAPQCIARYGYRFLSGGEYSFVMCLMSYKYDSRNPFPSQKRIAEDMKVQVRQIERWVDSLFNKKGLINIYERYKEDGTRTSNEYDFAPLLEKCLEESRKEKSKTEPKVNKKQRTRKKQEEPKAEEKAENIPPTNCTGYQNILPTNCTDGPPTNCTDDSCQNVGVDPQQNVGTKNVIEECNLNKGIYNNQSINEDIKKLDIGDSIKTVLKNNIDRLIDDDIKLVKIKNNYELNNHRTNEKEYARILNNVLTGVKSKIVNIEKVMNRAINNELKDLAADNKEKKQKDVVPEWFEERKAERYRKAEQEKQKYTMEDLQKVKAEFKDNEKKRMKSKTSLLAKNI